MITLLVLLWFWLSDKTTKAIHEMDLTTEELEEIEDAMFLNQVESLIEWFEKDKDIEVEPDWETQIVSDYLFNTKELELEKQKKYEEKLAEIEREEYRKIDKMRKRRVIQHNEILEYTCCSRYGKHPAHGTKRRDLAIAYKEARALKNKFLYENM